LRDVSLFSGCGGLDLGLTQAGFKIVLAVERDPLFASSYHDNVPTAPVHVGAVEDLSAELLNSASKGATREPIDLVAGGPPCPPYSKSRFYRKEKPRALGDPVGWSTLQGYMNVVRALRPRAFILENVAGLAYQIHRPAFDLVVEAARAEGYHCTWQVLNAADYGVPQVRERLFVVGMRDGKFEFPPCTHRRSASQDLFSQRLPRWRTAGEAIGDLDTEENAEHSGHFAGGQHHDLLRVVPPGDNYLYFTKERGHPSPKFRWRSRYWSFLLKLSPDLPSWTIQARRSNNMGPFHWRNRILRIQEIKRLQSFPDDWALNGTVEQQWRQLGNAVPPLLAAQIGTGLFDALRSLGKNANSRRRTKAS
jgi:DNA (cytosine-5)-methyltransferase 1